MTLFKTIGLPPLAAPEDQASWRVESLINGQNLPPFGLSLQDTQFEFPQPGMPDVVHGTVVHIELFAVDKSGNSSIPRVFDYTAEDVYPPPQPGEMSISGGRQAALSYFNTIELPPVAPGQTTWNLSAIINGQPQGSWSLPVGGTNFEFPLSNAPELGVGATVQLQLSAVDAYGNVSPARNLDYVVQDSYPPPQPGEMTVISGREA